METNTKKKLTRACLFACALLASATCSAWHGGGYHGGWHHGGAYHGYYHRGAWGGGWGGWGGTGIVIGVPLGGYYGPGYYSTVCQRVRVCNAYGQCWVRTQC